MTEAFLHYLWQYRLFDQKNLHTTEGKTVEVIRPGQYNTGSGPDFFNAQLRLDGTLWAGNVEIHMHASDWHRHRHHCDPAYDSCILHVVYENDAATMRMNGTAIPAVELKNKFQSYLWDNYLKLIGNRGWVPCQHRLKEIDPSSWQITIDRMIEERLEQKSRQILIALDGNKGDWEECFYQQLAKNFGFQLNAMPFEMLARSLPLKFVSKERTNPLHVEAMFFGQAGMLEGEFTHDYPCRLKEMYHYLAGKYGLKSIPYSAWKFLRLRPVNFPSIRIAQFARLYVNNASLFSKLLELSQAEEIAAFFRVQAPEYWNTHYHFGKSSVRIVKSLGRASVNNLLVNSVAPFFCAWAKYKGEKNHKERALAILRALPPEDNHIISRWKETGVHVHSSVDTQALIQLKLQHCSEKKCLTCSIGNRLINILP